MQTDTPDAHPLKLPPPILELCARLEAQGLACVFQGEALLEALRPRGVAEPLRSTENDALALSSASPDVPIPPWAPRFPVAPHYPTHSLVVQTDAQSALRALPGAVVTGEDERRLTHHSEAGPVDLLLTGGEPLEDVLPRFALGPLCFGFRSAEAAWVDPADQRAPFLAGQLTAPSDAGEAFRRAPRRFWITARLLAEYALDPAPGVTAAAAAVLPEVADQLPHAAPARRELVRILASKTPARGLHFLRDTGVTEKMIPGAAAATLALFDALPPVPALRWAAWLRGSATTSGLVRFRVPHALSRRVEKLQAAHPIERTAHRQREAGLRKLLSRFDAQEIEALLAWRGLEIEQGQNSVDPIQDQAALDALATRIQETRGTLAESQTVRALALDGKAVMARLATGPGPHVGRALAHLARLVHEAPEKNEAPLLEEALDQWAGTHLHSGGENPSEGASADEEIS